MGVGEFRTRATDDRYWTKIAYKMPLYFHDAFLILAEAFSRRDRNKALGGLIGQCLGRSPAPHLCGVLAPAVATRESHGEMALALNNEVDGGGRIVPITMDGRPWRRIDEKRLLERLAPSCQPWLSGSKLKSLPDVVENLQIAADRHLLRRRP